MKKALAAFSLAVMAGTIGILGLASPAQATEPKHTVTLVDACEGTTVTVANGWDRLPITVRGAGGEETRIDGGQQATLNVATVEPFTVEIKRRPGDWATLAEHTWSRPATCDPQTTPVWACDGWSLNFINPAALDAANVRFTLKLEPVVENVKLLWTVKPGGNESLALGKGVSAKVKIGRGEWADYKWQAPEGGCQSPSPDPTTPTPDPATPEPSATPGVSGGGPELPETGVAIAGVAGAGGALVIGGVGLAAIRRRRVTFKA